MSKTTQKGRVYLVGAGPGAAGLLTLRGAEALREADVVIYDALVNRSLLHLAPVSARLIFGGKRASQHAIPQDQLNQMLVDLAGEGKRVVRLKGGDPYIFGRGGEEIAHLAKAKIDFEVVPGVSSFSAAPAFAGIPLTHRDHSSGFVVITGYEDPDKPAPAVDWSAVANAPGTKIVFMGVKQIAQIADSLVGAGMAKKTPVAMIRWGTTGRQETITGTLANIAAVCEKSEFKPPAIIVIGEVVRLRDQLNWFEKRPLLGQRIVVTRAREQAGSLVEPFSRLGAEVLELPMIRTVAPADHESLIDAIAGLNAYQWLVFTSANGVDWFFRHFFKAFEDVRDIGGARIAAVGPATAARLRSYHLKVDVMPEKFAGAEVARAINDYESIENLSICLLRAEKAGAELPRELEAAGGIVDDIPVYRTVAEEEDRTGAGAQLCEHGAEWITFTSPSTVEHFHARFDLPGLLKKFPGLRIASIGPETTKALSTLKIEAAAEAREHTNEGLVAALSRAARRR
ncbi:MAG TPA: uroporphyrinogen-III C-methyltransferase [Verrucomicrobiales bacterium]|nr:uroporphyrinogen-III C-methyltransferase [Verrucomicrobiales bacterium]